MEEREMAVVPGLAGIPAAESAISYIDGEKGILEYRGIPINTLAEESSFLEVSYLLLYGKLPTAAELEKLTIDITCHTRLKLKILRVMEYLPENGHPMDFLQAVTSAMGCIIPRGILSMKRFATGRRYGLSPSFRPSLQPATG